MNILIPMAGRGKRFEAAGYSFPKPLIDVENKPMIQIIIENLNLPGKYIFLCQKEHCEKGGARLFGRTRHLNYPQMAAA